MQSKSKFIFIIIFKNYFYSQTKDTNALKWENVKISKASVNNNKLRKIKLISKFSFKIDLHINNVSKNPDFNGKTLVNLIIKTKT